MESVTGPWRQPRDGSRNGRCVGVDVGRSDLNGRCVWRAIVLLAVVVAFVLRMAVADASAVGTWVSKESCDCERTETACRN